MRGAPWGLSQTPKRSPCSKPPFRRNEYLLRREAVCPRLGASPVFPSGFVPIPRISASFDTISEGRGLRLLACAEAKKGAASRTRTTMTAQSHPSPSPPLAGLPLVRALAENWWLLCLRGVGSIIFGGPGVHLAKPDAGMMCVHAALRGSGLRAKLPAGPSLAVTTSIGG
jgi:hypothetical protein